MTQAYEGKPNHPVPAPLIEVDWSDADIGFVDLWIGNDPCQHIEFAKNEE